VATPAADQLFPLPMALSTYRPARISDDESRTKSKVFLDARYSLFFKKGNYKYVILGPSPGLIFHSFILLTANPLQQLSAFPSTRFLVLLLYKLFPFYYFRSELELFSVVLPLILPCSLHVSFSPSPPFSITSAFPREQTGLLW
jgi:hypothetical protein